MRRALMTSVSHITQRISEQNAEKFGADGWEISAHSGARPSHAVYQGRQYPAKDYERIVKPLIEDYNCRHSAFPIILGVSEPVYTEKELEEIDPKPFTYEGRTYTAYQAQQQMRKMERAMRKQKDRCITADAAGDKDGFTTASIKLRRQKDIYEKFCKAADSYTQYERTFVAGYDRRLAGKTGAVTRKQRAFQNAQLRLTDDGNGDIIKSSDNKADFTEVISNQKGMTADYQKALETKFSIGNSTAQKAFVKFVKSDSVEDSAYSATAFFSSSTQKVKMNYDKDLTNKRGAGTTFFHEHGHLIDYMSCEEKGYTSLKTPKFGELLRSDFNNYVNSVMKTNDIDQQTAYSVISKEIRGHSTHSVSDLFGGLSENKCLGNYKHDDSYWIRKGAIEKEAFAHMYEAQFDPNKYALMNKYFPHALSEFEKLLNEVIK